MLGQKVLDKAVFVWYDGRVGRDGFIRNSELCFFNRAFLMP
jgi:hypothetical protein